MKNLVQKCLERWNTAIEGKNASSNWQSFNYTVEHRHNQVWSGTCITNCIGEPKTKLAKTQKPVASQQNTSSKVISQTLSSVSQKGMGSKLRIKLVYWNLYHDNSNNSDQPIIWTPPYSRKKRLTIVHLNTHVWNYYSNIRTPTPCGARTGVAEHLLAFNSLCGATARITKRLPAYYRCFQTSTRLLQSFPNIY